MCAKRENFTVRFSHAARVSSSQPFVETLGDEKRIVEVRIRRVDAVDLVALSRRQDFVFIHEPNPREQALAPQNLMDAGNAACEVVLRSEERRVGVGDLVRQRRQGFGDRQPPVGRRPAALPPTEIPRPAAVPAVNPEGSQFATAYICLPNSLNAPANG